MPGDKEQTEGLLLVLDQHKNARGLKHWGDELIKRGIPAVLHVEKGMVDQCSNLIKGFSDKGFDIGGAYNEQPFWDKPYRFQHGEIHAVKDRIEHCTGKPMRVFGSRYFAYDENTLKAAEALGVECVFARGAVGAKAVTFKPEEYNVKIISVSNVPSSMAEMSTGSLCDESLWARGESAEGFKDILFSIKKEKKMVLVAQTHLSGVKLHWWSAYQDFLGANIIDWKSLDEFTRDPVVLPNAQIPVNTEVKYMKPSPKIPLEQEPDYPFEV
jgi:hypothetical protein